MNNVDSQYFELLNDIISNGKIKHSRAGDTLSVFGRMLTFDLSEGLPILTTKKMYIKGIVHELLWFLSGSTNIKYLVDNNIHIWDDDAYRHYCSILEEYNNRCDNRKFVVTNDFQKKCDKLTKDEFLNAIRNCDSDSYNDFGIGYRIGDLGDVYGKKWRDWYGIDQIKKAIETMKEKPDDRRMICLAFDPSVVDNVALPPCHVMFQLYSDEMTRDERIEWFSKYNGKSKEVLEHLSDDDLSSYNVPKRKLSLMWTQRSVDTFLGLGFNITSYAILANMIAHVCNMALGKLVASLGDCHIYTEHLDAVKEQLKNDPTKYDLPRLTLPENIKNIDKFKYSDINIEGYESYGQIKAKLLVG